jgi:hypothetical protein
MLGLGLAAAKGNAHKSIKALATCRIEHLLNMAILTVTKIAPQRNDDRKPLDSSVADRRQLGRAGDGKTGKLMTGKWKP